MKLNQANSNCHQIGKTVGKPYKCFSLLNELYINKIKIFIIIMDKRENQLLNIVFTVNVVLKNKHEIGILASISHHLQCVNGRHVQRRKLLGKLFQGSTYFF